MLIASVALAEDPGSVPSTHSGLGPLITLVARDLTPASDLCRHQAHT